MELITKKYKMYNEGFCRIYNTVYTLTLWKNYY
jgi:hypothetical protein